MTAAERTALTFRYEKWRAASSGVLETAATTFLLLIAVRWFQAGALAKAMVAAGSSVGLLAAPVVVSTVERLRWPTTRAAARIALAGAASFFGMALAPWLPVFVVGAMLGTACSSALVPLMTQVYQDNYPEARRGLLFSRTFMVRIAAAVGFGFLAGEILSTSRESRFAGLAWSGGISHFRWLLVAFGGAYLVAAFCLRRIPSEPLAASEGSHPFKALRHVRHDRLFRLTLISWMFLGFGNLMMSPLRVEYLANPKYGVTLHGAALTAGAIAFLTSVLPNLARLVLNPLWGWLFDRMNFFLLRMTLNVGFTLGILSFFTTDSFTGLVAGGILYGISIAGGDVAWSLWVTKFAPPERVADYMAVHTFFTGVRGVVAPVVAFQAAAAVSLPTLGWIGAGFILVGTLVLIPEVGLGKNPRRASALVEEVSE